MRILFFFIALTGFCQLLHAQPGATINSSEVTVTSPSAAAANPSVPVSPLTPETNGEDKVRYLDYKSVYEAETLEEEVKMATARFKLTPAQEEVWIQAAEDRRLVEKQAKEKLQGTTPNYEKDPIYRGLRTAQNTFHTTIVGHLNPAQKQLVETDRLILQEKQQRLAKIPPPPPPAPTVTVTTIDSTAIKEAEKAKTKGKSKRKKK